MTTMRDKFHELGNWHNKISMAAIVTREVLSDEELGKLSPQAVKERIGKSVANLEKI